MSQKTEEKDVDSLDIEDVDVDDVLDFVRKSEKLVKGKMLLKATKKVKEYASDIALLKMRSKILLEEIGLDTKDIQKVTDFVNQLPEIKNIPNNVIEGIRESQRDFIRKDKKVIQEAMDKRSDEISKSFPYMNIDNLQAVHRPNMNGAFYDGQNFMGYNISDNTLVSGWCALATATTLLSNSSNHIGNATCAVSIPFGDTNLVVKI